MKSMKSISITICTIFIPVYLMITCAIGLWTQRNLEFWIGALKGHEIHVSFILSWILSVFTSVVIFPLNIIGEIARLFM